MLCHITNVLHLHNLQRNVQGQQSNKESSGATLPSLVLNKCMLWREHAMKRAEPAFSYQILVFMWISWCGHFAILSVILTFKDAYYFMEHGL